MRVCSVLHQAADHPNPDDWIFETKISAPVKESDEMYRSNVLTYLDLFCTSVLSQETAEEPRKRSDRSSRSSSARNTHKKKPPSGPGKVRRGGPRFPGTVLAHLTYVPRPGRIKTRPCSAKCRIALRAVNLATP